MKKIIIIGALVGCSLLFAEAPAQSTNIYVGLDIIGSTNNYTRANDNYLGSADIGTDSQSNAFKLKIGLVREDGWKTQVYYIQEDYEKAPFDSLNKQLSEVGIDFIKEYKLSPVLFPYAQAGLGYGWMDVDSDTYNDASMDELSAKVGVGLLFKVAIKFEIIAGVDYQYRKWSDLEIGTSTIKTEEQSTRYYLGANYHF